MEANDISSVEEEVFEVKTFLNAAKEVLSKVINERKAVLKGEVGKTFLKETLEELLPYWNDLSVDIFDSNNYESILEAEKIFLTLCLIYYQLLHTEQVVISEDSVVSTEVVNESVNSQLSEEDTSEPPEEVEASSVVEVSPTTNNESGNEEEDSLPARQSSPTPSHLDISTLKGLLQTFCDFLENSQSRRQEDVLKSIKNIRRVKVQVTLLTMICFSLQQKEDNVHLIGETSIANFFSKEDIYMSFMKIVPKSYNYNLYMKYYYSFLKEFCSSFQHGKTVNILITVFGSVHKLFPDSEIIPFEERYDMVINTLGMNNSNLEDCCERIDISAYTLSNESPIEMSQKMINIWLLLESSNFLSFDDNCMAIYVFSGEISLFHTQLMRIFYILNRIDESVQDIGYLSYSTPKFVGDYMTIYTELHIWFTKLVKGLSKNYEIYEIECDKVTGAIMKKAEPRPLILAELQELSIYMTCPLATLDSILRLSFERTDVPVLFDEDQERFIFTTPPSSLLSIHEFISSDRERFATHTVELYPCLDRHFQRFHKSKKADLQSINTALPPSYHLFAKTIQPPEYQMFYTPPEPTQSTIPMAFGDLEAQQVIESMYKENDKGCFCFCLTDIVPAMVFLVVFVVLLFWAVSSF